MGPEPRGRTAQRAPRGRQSPVCSPGGPRDALWSLPGPQNGSTGLWGQNGGAASRRAAGRRGRGRRPMMRPEPRRPGDGGRRRGRRPACVPGVRPRRTSRRASSDVRRPEGAEGAEGVGRSRGSPENMAWPGPRRSADPLYGPAGRQILWRHDQAEGELQGAENGPGRARRISGSNPSDPPRRPPGTPVTPMPGRTLAITETIHHGNGTHQSQPPRKTPVKPPHGRG